VHSVQFISTQLAVGTLLNGSVWRQSGFHRGCKVAKKSTDSAYMGNNIGHNFQ